MSSETNSLEFFVNGEKRVLTDVHPRLTLLDYLRNHEGHTGTKHTCGQGGCGACTVTVSSYDPVEKRVVHKATNSCLKPLASLAGQSVTTVEGIGSTAKGLHPVQERIAEKNGSQCGYCTPGMVMSMYSLLQKKDGKPSLQEIEGNFDGNLCRCTGYRSILSACHTFATNCADCPADMEDIGKFKPYDHANDPKPPQDLAGLSPHALRFSADGVSWHKVVTMSQLLELRKTAQAPVKYVVANTSFGVYGESLDSSIKTFVDIKDIPELNLVTKDSKGLTVGSAVTIAKLISYLQEFKDPTFDGVVAHLSKVSGNPIRDVASWAGNLMMCRNMAFPSDVVIALYGANARITVVVNDGKLQEMDMGTFLASKDDIIVASMFVPVSQPGEHFKSYRVALRPQNSHALVNASFRATLDGSNIKEIAIVYGVVDVIPVRATKTESFLAGKDLSNQTFAAALEILTSEIHPHPEKQYFTLNQQNGKESFRKSLIRNFFYKYFLHLASLGGKVAPNLISASQPFSRPISGGKQVPNTQPGRTGMPKIGAHSQATGEAIYSGDIPDTPKVLYGAFASTTVAAVTIKKVDVSEALAMPGVFGHIGAADIPGANDIGVLSGEEQLFATEKSPAIGIPVVLILAKTQREANAAACKVKIEYGEQYEKPVYSLEEAIERKAIFPISHSVSSGDIEKGFATSDHVITGEVKTGGQHAFYLERITAYAVPQEGDHMVVHVGMQSPDYTRQKLAAILKVSGHDVTVSCRRAGGGFGGKITRHVATAGAATVAARKFKRPVKIALSIQDDLGQNGGRHAFLARYKLGFSKEGKIQAVELESWGEGGFATDFSGALVLEYNEALDSVYYFPNFKSNAHIAKTNLATKTAVRSFGHSQSVLVTETLIHEVAMRLGKTDEEIREVNMYTDRNCITPFGQHLENFSIPKLYKELKASSDYESRLAKVREFNSNNKWKKRGISLLGIKYGLCLGYTLNTHALVNINGSDGTVVVFHGGAEIGQGMHTKVAQTVAMTLGCPLERVRIGDTNTDVSPNSMFTGGSVGTEANCEAARLACVKLNERLFVIKNALWKEKPEHQPTWDEVVASAKAKSVLLSETGNFVPAGRGESEYGLPWQKNWADYYVYGCAVSEVEVDTLTGEIQIIRSDILYDNGRSINPTIDVGQAEGAFVMGIGYFLREEVLTNTEGRVVANDTWEYKPPCSADIPIDLRVEFLKETSFPKNVMQQKGVGEPPMVLAYSTASAVRAAISASRADRKITEPFRIDAPMTVDRIQDACAVSAADLVL